MEPIKIDIFNSTYAIKTDYDPEYVAELASFVDKKMREVYDKSNTASTQKVAVLSSISIADEMFKLKNRGEKASGELDERVIDLIRMIDSVMNA